MVLNVACCHIRDLVLKSIFHFQGCISFPNLIVSKGASYDTGSR